MIVIEQWHVFVLACLNIVGALYLARRLHSWDYVAVALSYVGLTALYAALSFGGLNDADQSTRSTLARFAVLSLLGTQTMLGIMTGARWTLKR